MVFCEVRFIYPLLSRRSHVIVSFKSWVQEQLEDFALFTNMYLFIESKFTKLNLFNEFRFVYEATLIVTSLTSTQQTDDSEESCKDRVRTTLVIYKVKKSCL